MIKADTINNLLLKFAIAHNSQFSVHYCTLLFCHNYFFTFCFQEYKFEESNPFNGLKNSFEEGVKKLEEGDLISAILLFEEAVIFFYFFIYKSVIR